MLSFDDVLTVYRTLLGRDPESRAVLESVAASADSAQVLSAQLLNTDECRRHIAYGVLPKGGSQWVCAEVRGGLKLWIDLLKPSMASGVLQDNWKPSETGFILSVLRPGDVFVDVGANVGWFTMLAAAAVGETGHVHAFEPRRDIVARLNQSVTDNGFGGRCTVRPVALAAESGEIRVTAVPQEQNPGYSFLVPAALPDGAVDFGAVPVETLDGLNITGPVRLIKVDVKGAEGLVLRGAASLLTRDQPIIVSEIFPRWLATVSTMRPSDYLHLLHSHGYRVFHLVDGGIGAEIHRLVTGLPEYLNVVALPPAIIDLFLSQALDHRVSDLERGLSALRAQLDDGIGAAKAREDAYWATEQVWKAGQRDDAKAIATLTAELGGLRAARDADEAERTGIAARLTEADRRLEGELAKTDRLRSRLHEATLRAYRVEVSQRAELDELAARTAIERQVADAAQVATQTLVEQLRGQLATVAAERDAIRYSTAWRITAPLRRAGAALPPGLKRTAVQTARLGWWTLSLQLPQRIRWRHAAGMIPSLPLPVAALQSTPALALPLLPPQLLPAPVPVPPCLVGVERPVVMIIDRILPQPNGDGGSIDAVKLTETLILFGFHVIFVPMLNTADMAPYRDALVAQGGRCFGPEDAPTVQAFIERHGEAVSLFVLSRYAVGGQFLELIRYNCPQARIMFNTVGLHFLREEREAELTGSWADARAARRTRKREQFLALRSDVTLVVSSAEQALLSAAVPGSRVVALPLARTGKRGPIPGFAQRRDIGFVGDYDYRTDIDAMQFFLAEVWPRLRDVLPDARFLIVGAELPDGVVDPADRRVIYQGHTSDLDSWLDAVRLTVAPLRFGAELKGKVIFSIAAGVPCVGTTVAMEGIAAISDEHVLIADMPDRLAAEILRLYADPVLWQRLSQAGQALAATAYSIDSYRETMLDTLVGLGLPCLTPCDSALP